MYLNTQEYNIVKLMIPDPRNKHFASDIQLIAKAIDVNHNHAIYIDPSDLIANQMSTFMVQLTDYRAS